MSDVFLSYSTQAPEPTAELASRLTGRGFQVWYDVNLLPGQFFGKVIDDAIDRARAVVTIWSPPALTSRWVPAESARALQQNKLICVRTPEVQPQQLPTPFHTMHVPLCTEVDGLIQALVAMGVRPSGVSGSSGVTDFEQLRSEAQRDWAMIPKDDVIALESFLELYSSLAMFRVMAERCLRPLRERAATVVPAPAPAPIVPARAEDVKLRLDPGMHTAMIRRIAVTADGRLLATASEDKTIRLWELPEGRLVRTLRPPIGDGDEGKVNAVAIDPAGGWVAAGGWMTPSGTDEYVTLFDATSGSVRARLGPLPTVLADLAVSPDGTRLAAGLGTSGIRVWELTRALRGEDRTVFEDRDVGGSVYGLDFGPSGTPSAGRLAATSDDGQIHLYGPDGTLLAKMAVPGGRQPFGIAFSPDGMELAVGYDDSVRVDRLEAGTLRFLGSADGTGISGGNLSKVAFLAPRVPGAAPRLVAGGTHGAGSSPIFTWSEAGRGARSPWPGPENTVMDVAPLPDGSVLFGSADPAFGRIDGEGRRTLFRGPATADLCGKLREHFTVSADGRRLRFGLKQRSGVPVRFDLVTRTLADAPEALSDLLPANTDRLTIEGWEDGKAPQINGASLPLQTYEMSRSLAIAPDAASFVLGTDWWLRRFDARGKSLWEKPVPGTVWGVNLAREGRLILAAYADGTIRWHRAADGAELLALFIHLPEGPEGPREWILFTPEGYYEASGPEAEKLIGWHINRGPEQAADFYPADTFASVYRSPDRIRGALDGV